MEARPAKPCVLCGLLRPGEEPECTICGCAEFGDPVEPGPDLGERLVAASRWQDAYAYYEHQVARTPEDGHACMMLAWLALVVGDFRAVEVWAHEAQRQIPESPSAHILLGLVLKSASRWEECLAEFDAGLSRLPQGSRRQAVLSTLRTDVRAKLPAWW